MRTLLLMILSMGVATSWAHPGHGMDSVSHWHATDLWGFLALAVAVGALLWWTNGR